ncbi:Aste57867_21281 [Aphanomyces stellatus]|uniref:Aste57867_21281 protein n=1 Tax=Aphanomyces stellatus TaxID=120398 RepID=A0A485LHT0_9STRA|nr:hypothetical protein As57867_021212 [Aphanomyces stellatus]VFT97953.1 Aste57867_21281 [Aphanomyces stellatus]
MIAFPSIEQYRHVIATVKHQATYVGRDDQDRPVYDDTQPLPVLTFQGTTKLHGSNTAVVFHPESDDVTFQSRSRQIAVGDDFMGFAAHMTTHRASLDAIRRAVVAVVDPATATSATLAVFGEWCGGPIQRGVALAELPKMFVVFAVRVGDDQWLDLSLVRDTIEFPDARIFHIHRFGTWTIEIDFTSPEDAQVELERITTAVEAECPAGKHFGVSGIGEGVVWKCVTDPSSRFWFKVKGREHESGGGAAKTAKKSNAASVNPEQVASLQAFVDHVVSEGRLYQGLSVLNERGIERTVKATGEFVKWIQQDVLKEDADTMAANAFETKHVMAPIARKASDWFQRVVRGGP